MSFIEEGFTGIYGEWKGIFEITLQETRRGLEGIRRRYIGMIFEV